MYSLTHSQFGGLTRAPIKGIIRAIRGCAFVINDIENTSEWPDGAAYYGAKETLRETKRKYADLSAELSARMSSPIRAYAIEAFYKSKGYTDAY